MMTGITRGMQYLHGCGVLHLDLKSPNVLISNDWTPKLCDFGLAKISMQQAFALSARQSSGFAQFVL